MDDGLPTYTEALSSGAGGGPDTTDDERLAAELYRQELESLEADSGTTKTVSSTRTADDILKDLEMTLNDTGEGEKETTRSVWDGTPAKQESSFGDIGRPLPPWEESPEFICECPSVGSPLFIYQFFGWWIITDILCIIFAALKYDDSGPGKTDETRRENRWMQALMFLSSCDLFFFGCALPTLEIGLEFLGNTDFKVSLALTYWLFLQLPWLVHVYLLCAISSSTTLGLIVAFGGQRIFVIVFMPFLACFSSFFHELMQMDPKRKVMS